MKRGSGVFQGTLFTFDLSVSKGSSCRAAPHMTPILKEVNLQFLPGPYAWAYSQESVFLCSTVDSSLVSLHGSLLLF